MTSNPPLIAPPRSHSHESCEPEEHCEKLDASDGELVGCARETGGCKSEICDCEKGPDGGEEHESHAGRHPGYISIDKVGNETKDDDAEDDLDAAKAKYDSGSDHSGGCAIEAVDAGSNGVR